MFLVHSKNDPVISSTWTQYAYDYLTAKRTNNAPIYYRVITSSNHGYRVVGEHFAWERMLNNDIVAEILDAGERVNKIIIYMNGDKIDASTLKPENFNVTVWAEDASGLNLEGATCGGELMQAGITKDTPAKVKVYDIFVNTQGNKYCACA